MELTEHNFQSVLGINSARLQNVFPQVFERLIDPNLNEMALFRYAMGIQERLQKDADSRQEGQMGFTPFGRAAFEGGIVKAMMKITKDGRTDRWHGLASYFAMDTMWQLTRMGTSGERRKLLKQLLEYDALNICVDKLQNHPLVIHRQVAACLLRCLCSESYLGEMISTQQTSELMVALCHHILAGPDIYRDQLSDPILTWQSFLSFNKFGAPEDMAAAYAPRYYAMSQENAAWAIQGLLLRYPPPNQQSCHEILAHNPDLLSLLFQCAALPRPEWYPESFVGAIICEALAMFYRAPRFRVAGIEVNLDDHPSEKEVEKEWDAVLASCNLLTSRPDWVSLILQVWNTMVDEKFENIKRMFREAPAKYHGGTKYSGLEILESLCESRGSCRIALERLIATLLCRADSTNISDADLLSLLPLAKGGSRDIVTDINRIETKAAQIQYFETMHEIYRKPLSATFTGEEVEPPSQIAPEFVLGPTVFARLLTELARRGILETIPSMTSLPKGVAPRTTLSKIKEIAGPTSIRQFLVLARKRITARRETGHERFKERDMDYACFAYATAAELAAALVAFDVITKDNYNYSQHLGGVRREQVLCLGNAAEMALGLRQYDRALYFATASVEAAHDLPDKGGLDAVDEGIKAKNRRRVERALSGLSA